MFSLCGISGDKRGLSGAVGNEAEVDARVVKLVASPFLFRFLELEVMFVCASSCLTTSQHLSSPLQAKGGETLGLLSRPSGIKLSGPMPAFGSQLARLGSPNSSHKDL